MLSLLSATVFGLASLSAPTRADDSEVIKLTPQIQAMLSQLLKAADADAAEEAKPDSPSSTPAPTPEAAGSQQPKASPLSTALRTSSLRTGGLATSTLGGHGLLGGAPRLTNEEWRQLFPVRK